MISIIKALLFIVILIFAVESFNTIQKSYNNWFAELFTDPSTSNPSSSNPSTTNPSTTNPSSSNPSTTNPSSSNPSTTNPSTTNPFANFRKDKDCAKWRNDTVDYAAFRPLIYNPNTEYYYNREYAVSEGIRRHNDVKAKLKLLQAEYDKATDENIKKIIGDELQTHKWENYILSPTAPNGEKRLVNDIITDYMPDEIGCDRPWIECHSHLPAYSLSYYKGLDDRG
jgi:hypothetical protein